MTTVGADMRAAHQEAYDFAQLLTPTTLRGLTLGDHKAMVERIAATLGSAYSTLLFAAKTSDWSRRGNGGKGNGDNGPVALRIAGHLSADLPEVDATLSRLARSMYNVRATVDGTFETLGKHCAALQARQPRDTKTSPRGRSLAARSREVAGAMHSVDRQVYKKALNDLDIRHYGQFLTGFRAFVDCLRAICVRLAKGVAITYGNIGWSRRGEPAATGLTSAARGLSGITRALGELDELVAKLWIAADRARA